MADRTSVELSDLIEVATAAVQRATEERLFGGGWGITIGIIFHPFQQHYALTDASASTAPAVATGGLSMSSLSDQLKAARIAGNLERLLYLDRVWTKYLEGAKPLDSKEIPTMHAVAADMLDLLQRCSDDCEWAQKFISSNAVVIEKNLVDIVPSMGLSAENEAALLRRFNGGIGKALCCANVDGVALLAEESREIARKLELILSGKQTAGDLGNGGCFVKGVLCGVALIAETLFGAYIGLELNNECP